MQLYSCLIVLVKSFQIDIFVLIVITANFSRSQNKIYKMNFVCAICIDAFGTELEVVSASCGHCFHRKCIGKWIEQ